MNHDKYNSKSSLVYLGARKDITDLFSHAKQRVRSNHSPDQLQRDRFKAKSKFLVQKQPENQENESKIVDLEIKQNYKHKQMEEASLPPEWIDIQEDIDDNIINIQNYYEELRPLMQKRFGNFLFDDQGAQRLDENISLLVTKISKLLKGCEQQLREIINNIENNSKVKQKIIRNVQQRYMSKIQGFTQKLKQVEKLYVQKMTDLHGTNYMEYEQNDKQLKYQESKLKYSNEQVNNIVQQMTDLAEIYKEMNRIVIEQGTVMDRIDYNIVDTKENVIVARKHIESIMTKETSQKSQKCIVGLVQMIIICVGIILFEHM